MCFALARMSSIRTSSGPWKRSALNKMEWSQRLVTLQVDSGDDFHRAVGGNLSDDRSHGDYVGQFASTSPILIGIGRACEANDVRRTWRHHHHVGADPRLPLSLESLTMPSDKPTINKISVTSSATATC